MTYAPSFWAIAALAAGIVLMALVVAVTWWQYRVQLAVCWQKQVVVRFRNRRERFNRWLLPRLNSYFESRLNQNARVHRDDCTFTMTANSRWLWVKRSRTFHTAYMQRVEFSEVWFVELQTSAGRELVRNNAGELFFDQKVAEGVANGAVCGTLNSRQEHFDSSSGYGVYWAYAIPEDKRGLQGQCFFMKHPAAPGETLGYVSVSTQPAKGIIRHGAYRAGIQTSKNKPQAHHINQLRQALNRAIHDQEQALSPKS